MLDVTEQLRRYADAVVETVDAVPAAPVDSVNTQAARPRRPVWQPLVAAAAVVTLLAGGLWFANDVSDSSRPDVSTGGRTGVEMLDPGPLSPRSGATVVWTGQEVMVWGGSIEAANQGIEGPDREFADGAAYNPETRHWRRIADAPLPANRLTPVGVATNRGVVVARGEDAALWNPEANAWTRLENAPGAVTDLAFTGTEVLSVSANARLDIATGQWEPLPAPPQTLGRPVGIWDGTELIVVGQKSFSTSGAVAFDPGTSTWRELADPTGLDSAAVSAAREGDRVVFVDYEMHVVAFRRDADGGAWQTLPPVPARFYEHSPTIAAAPPALVVWMSTALVVRLNDLWTPLPYDELELWGSSYVVTPPGPGDDRASLFIFGITPDGEQLFARLDPERLVEERRELEVGVVRVQLPDGVQLTGSSYDTTPGLGGGEQVLVELSTPAGKCTMTSTYGGDVAKQGWAPVDSSRREWVAQATTSDVVRLACPDAASAEQIVAATILPTFG